MKKILSTIAVILFLLFSVNTVNGAGLKLTFVIKSALFVPKDSLDVIAIQKRVQEIQVMNFSELTTNQRRAIRNELRGMYKQLHDGESGGHSTYIVISGGLIIVILLLILILR